ncbi:hypothetical protein Nepgr_003642 [Nepenthes gracilis]|uniref:RING-type E3 ubiquitin transferase n=1 Tax=Nepenthes gracilis TaxID=150966 RepID=A0AAD3S001_NEPGR|nr:hypothetical protein Nepgr_003642 [Nepenthes gracilis]
MGSVCGCFHVRDDPENASSSDSDAGNYFCPHHLLCNLCNKYTSMFQKREVHVAPSTAQSTAPVISGVTIDISEANKSQGAQPNSVSLGYQPLRPEAALRRGDKNKESCSERRSKKCCPEDSTKIPAKGGETEFCYAYPLPDDEEVCPTCLEEFIPENPQIVTECSHHFHLGCIYEWMERSETCPLCSRVMVFSELKT